MTITLDRVFACSVALTALIIPLAMIALPSQARAQTGNAGICVLAGGDELTNSCPYRIMVKWYAMHPGDYSGSHCYSASGSYKCAEDLDPGESVDVGDGAVIFGADRL